MVSQNIEIIIWNNKAFVPSSAYYPNGIFTSIEPIHVLNPTLVELVPVVSNALAQKPHLLPEPTQEEIRRQQELLPRVTRAHSWKRLCRLGISYVIEVSDKGYLLEMSRLDKNGRWEFDPKSRKIYPHNTDLTIIIRALLDDFVTRPVPAK